MEISINKWNGWPKNRAAIIAEVGMNHNGDEAFAWKLIKSAHEHGADFVKLQSFVTESFFHPKLHYFSNIKSLELPFSAQIRLFQKAKKAGIKLITTPYDFASVDLAEEFSPVAYKIASMDNDNLPLIRYIARKNRPLIISTGMATLDEIGHIVTTVNKTGNKKLVLLHCVSNYPAKPQDLNLAMMGFLKDRFQCPIGFSDHSLGLFSSYMAISLFAAVIEKHFTSDRSLAKKYPDADHEISILPKELQVLSEFSKLAPIMMGKAHRIFEKEEFLKRKTFRRSLFAKRDIMKDEIISLENVILLRPVYGIKAGDWDMVAGKRIKRAVRKLQPIYASYLD